MYFSGKVTNSVLCYLEENGSDLEKAYNLTDLSPTFLRDPSHWLASHQVEAFLDQLQNLYGSQLSVNNLCQTVGHKCHTLHSWGVLDSVLKMMMSPLDIFTQPQRFISYFISPAPQLDHLRFDKETVYFELPISNEEYPLFSSYLKTSLESLPQFMGKPMAYVEWERNELKVSWEDRQQDLITIDTNQLKPEFVQDLLTTIENIERELEERNSQLQSQKTEIDTLKSQLDRLSDTRTHQTQEPLSISFTKMKHQFMTLSDYLVRAQQLITLLVAQGRKDQQVKEAMRRVYWEQVQSDFTHVVEEGLEQIKKIRYHAAFERGGELAKNSKNSRQRDPR